ncbi:Exodeoxyribonuclease VII large subunit [Synechococcus sp. PCC 6312]|nr:Exodeoxyribonuclease VII large subunit [Synechococcus sp. PCC 6312]
MLTHNPDLLIPPTVQTVAELTDYIRGILEQDPELIQVCVTGEVSSVNPYPSGLFFTLSDPTTQATIQCVVWQSSLRKLVTTPSPGEQVIIIGRIQVYGARGTYRLTAWQVLPAGEGLQALRLKQLKDRLAAAGCFDPERKRPLPNHPQVIAVVTSMRAAAWGDIQRTLKNRYPGLKVLLSPALVQGELAPDSIVAALQRIQADGRAEVIILSRGGGAKEDLGCFNDERVVRAIAQCQIPIIAGIGHQRDETLADLAADVCAHTPTAAAQLAVPSLADLYQEHQQRVARLQTVLQVQWQTTHRIWQQQQQRLKRVGIQQTLHWEQQHLQRLKTQLQQAALGEWQRESHHHQLLRERLQGLNPQAILNRGYAIACQASGHTVSQANDLKSGELLTLHLAQGQVKVRVEKIIPSYGMTNPLVANQAGLNNRDW